MWKHININDVVTGVVEWEKEEEREVKEQQINPQH